MATIKFSEFNPGNINVAGAQLVGLTGGNTATNARFTAADLVNGLATVTYVDSQDAGLQSQITQNTNDIANIDLSGLQSNVSTLQGQVSVLQGNIVVLDSAVAALENNVSVNSNDITTIRGNIVAIENELANIADTDAQTLTWDGANANLSISNGNNVVLQEVLDNAGNITVMQGQIADLQANGNIQTLSLDNSSNVLSISGGNTVDFTTVLGNVVGADAQTLSWDQANSNLSISGGNTVTINVGGGGGNYSNANVQALGEAGWSGNIIPSANITYDLGNATNRWKDLYLSDATIYLGNTELSTANGSITVDGTKVKNTFGTTISIVNTSTDVYNRNGVLPADPKGQAVADPNGKSGWYWKSPGPTADPAGLNSFQWKMFNNDGPQAFTVADIDYIYMIVDLYTVGQVYFNVYTAGVNPAPTAFQSRFSFSLNSDFSSTGRYLMWAKPPGSDITVDDVEVYPFLERLELPYDASSSSGTLLTSEAIKSVNVQTRTSPALSEGEVEFNLKSVGYKVNNSYIQNFDMEIYGGDQSLSLDNSSNVLTISNGGNVDFTTVLGNVAGGGGNPFDQDLNTTDDVTFNATTINGNMDVNGAGTHSFQGTIEFTQITNFGGTVGITSILDEDNMVSDSATALATQQSIKAYIDAKITSGVMVQVHGSWDASAGAAFNWGTDEIASHGISNVTRDSTGIYTVTFETPFASNAYTATFGVGSTDYSGTGASPREVSLLSRNAGNCQVICERSDDAVNEDNFYMSLMICGVI